MNAPTIADVLAPYSNAEIDRIFNKQPDPIRTRCKREGRAGFYRGPVSSSPYPPDTAEHFWWQDGWLTERAENS